MRRAACVCGLACLLAFVSHVNVWAQVSVAVIDMGAVFESHPMFLSQLESLKQEIREFEAQQQAQREGLSAKFQLLRGQDPSSEAYRTGEAEIASQTANLDVQKRLRSKEFAQKEAKIYFEIYTDVTAKINAYCQHYGIETVVHYNSRPMDVSNPATIMERIGSNVVFARPEREITEAIKLQCGGQQQAASGGNLAPAGVNR
jgi:Skp family chaperone for outer membrane proteins